MTKKPPSLFSVLKPYKIFIWLLVMLTLAGNALNLLLPKIIAKTIDSFVHQSYASHSLLIQFTLIAGGIFILGYIQNIVQTYASERVARDLREQLIYKISKQNFSYVEKVSPSKLLTNLTSDIDSIKTFVAQAISSLISSVFIIIGASVLLLLINWKLALTVLSVVPVIGVMFFLVLMRVRKLFKRSQEAIDWLNRVINESILGAALIRLFNSGQVEYQKFLNASEEARNIGMSILRLFATLIPVITFATNGATLVILMLGGYYVIGGTMTLGEFTAFNSYLAILIFPIFIIGFMSNVFAQAGASYERIREVLEAVPEPETGTLSQPIGGQVSAHNISLAFGDKYVLKNISFEITPGTRTAIIGPTAAGKTQLLSILIGLTKPTEGEVRYDGEPLAEYDRKSLHAQVALVFQDSILFNVSVLENIAFSASARNDDTKRAIETAELADFIETLPQKLDTIVSERGSSLSGGQKQRIMLARALALNPKVLLLDDFTARVDTQTEQKIVHNITRNYPGITLISVTQKIAPIETYDQILLLMEGELLARGTHSELMHTSPEYVQIYNSQKSTKTYEVQA